MTEAQEYPSGFLPVMAGILGVMTVNAALLTVRDLSGRWSAAGPLTAAAIVAAALGLVVAAGAMAADRWVAAFRYFAVMSLASCVLAAAAPADIAATDGVPWTFHLGFVGMLAGAICLRPTWMIAYGVVAILSEAVVGGGSPATLALLLTSATTIVAGFLLLRRVAEILLATRRAQQRFATAAVDQANASAAEGARDRWDAWVHDHVLVALRLGSQQEPTAMTHAEALLRTGLSRPEELHSGLRSGALATAKEHGLRVRWDVAQSGTLPEPVGYALQQAIGEALRNAARHSGATTASITGAVSSSALDLAVTDAGDGFDPDATAKGLGIRSSILGQMEAVGGSATIVSAPRMGTQVRLRWRAQALPAATLELPLHWAVSAAAAVSILSAARATFSLGPERYGWVGIGLVVVLTLTGIMIVAPRLTLSALGAWLVSATILALNSPVSADPERVNWLAMGSAVIFISAARNRREAAGLVAAVATFVAQLAASSMLRPDQLMYWMYWAQPVMYAALAWLGLVLLQRLLNRYRRATAQATQLEQDLVLRQAEREEGRRRINELPDDLVPILDELAHAPAVSDELAQRCAVAEASTRDHLTAPRLLTPELDRVFASLRAHGAYISVRDAGPGTSEAELVATRELVLALVPLVQSGSRLTIRWTIGDPAHFATVTLTGPKGKPDLSGLAAAEVIVDENVLQLRLLTLGPGHVAAAGTLAGHPSM